MTGITITKALLARGALGPAVIAVCIASGFSPSSERALASASVATPVTASVLDDCVVCFEWYCDSDWHDAFDWEEYGEEWQRNGGAHNSGPCWEGTCDTRHGPYGCTAKESTPLTDGDIEKLRAAVVASDTRQVSAILSAHPQRLALNVERSAVQLVSCDGSVGMHLPMPAWMTRAATKAVVASSVH